MDDLVKELDSLPIDSETLKTLKNILSQDCKKDNLDKKLKDDCSCPTSSIGDNDPCLEKFLNRFQVIANNGDFRGISFNGENLIPCLELDILFNCTMLSERLKDGLINGVSNFVRTQIGNSSSMFSRFGNTLGSAIMIG